MSALLAGCQSVGVAIFNAAAPDVEREASIAFGEGERRRMDLYTPRKPGPESMPLIVFWYGGSWQMGDRADYRFVGAALAARGAVVVVPDYRLYPEVRFPDFLRDAAAAVATAQREAVRHGANPRRTVLGGHSAGAYIAAMLANQPRYLREAGVDPASIAGFFGLSGPYAVDPNTTALRAIFDSMAKPSEYQVVPQVHALSPPALLVHGEDDETVYVSHTLNLAAALRGKGVAVEVHLIPGRKHADTVVALSRPGAFRIPGLLSKVSEFAAHLPDQRRARDAMPVDSEAADSITGASTQQDMAQGRPLCRKALAGAQQGHLPATSWPGATAPRRAGTAPHGSTGRSMTHQAADARRGGLGG